MQFGMNNISSPYAHGIVQKQISLQNQNKQPSSLVSNNNSHKEIQLIQAYQQHTQRLKDQAQNFKKSRGQPRSIDAAASGSNIVQPNSIWQSGQKQATDQINTVRQPPNKNQFQTVGHQFSNPTTGQGSQVLSTTRSVVQNKSKLIDSKLSSLRLEQDSTAASNINTRFPMTADEAFKVLSPYLWDVEKREIFEY